MKKKEKQVVLVKKEQLEKPSQKNGAFPNRMLNNNEHDAKK